MIFEHQPQAQCFAKNPCPTQQTHNLKAGIRESTEEGKGRQKHERTCGDFIRALLIVLNAEMPQTGSLEVEAFFQNGWSLQQNLANSLTSYNCEKTLFQSSYATLHSFGVYVQ